MLYIDVFMHCMTHIPDESTPAEFVTTEQGISNDIFTRWSVTHVYIYHTKLWPKILTATFA